MKLPGTYRCALNLVYSFLFGLIVNTVCMGQAELETKFQFHHLTPDDGLSQVSVSALIKDYRGYIWLGTQDGLNRYDGNTFTVFRHNPSDSTTISGNRVSALYEDESGRIWVGTVNNGLSLYDPRFGHFIRLKLNSPSSQISNTTVTCIESVSQEEVWVGTRNDGLFRVKFDLNGIPECTRLDQYPELIAIHGMIRVDENQILIGGDGKVFSVSVSAPMTKLHQLVIPGLRGIVKSFALYQNKYVWMGTEGGLYFYDLARKQGHIQDIENPQQPNQSRPCEVNQLFLDENHTLWIAAGHGLFLLSKWNENQKRFTHSKAYKHNPENPSSISHNSVLSLLIKPENIFVGTSRFANVITPKPKFVVVKRAPTLGTSINNNIIFSFYKDSTSNDLWVGTSGGGLNLKRGDVYYYFIESDDPNSISDNIIRGIEKGPDNKLWLATTKGLSIVDLNTFDPERPKFITYISDLSSTTGLQHNNLRDVLFHDNQIWVISAGGGLSQFVGDLDKEDFFFRVFRHQPLDPTSINSDIIHCILPDQNDFSFWLGTENGLCHVQFNSSEYKQPTFTRYTRDPENSNSIGNNSVHDLSMDLSGVLWIATGYGFCSFNPMTQTFTRYGTEDGLADPIVYSVQEDEYDNLWLGTNNGLSRFNKTLGIFQNFQKEEGLQDLEFNIKTKFKDENGLIYLGGISGFNIFNPLEFLHSNNPVPIFLDRIKIDNSNSPTQKYVPVNSNSIDISYRDFPLHIGFSAPDGDPQRTIQYEYLLEPLRTSWNNLGSENSISFPDLSPGHYNLHIQGKEHGVSWETDPLTLSIHVAPPWWRSTWAYFVYGLLLFGLFYTFYQFQIQRKLAREEARRLKELDNMKSRLYTNITHEFRTPLTVILGMVNELKERLKGGTETKQLELVEQNSKNLLNLVNQMLDLAKLEKGNIKPLYVYGDIILFLNQIVESFYSLSNSEGISLTFYSEVDVCEMDYDEQKILQIISNLLGNAIKFCSSGDHVVMHLNKLEQEQRLMIKIKDTGPGIAPEYLQKVFDRFYQVDDTHTRRGEGTGIGLALAKELIELMNGSLIVDSTVNAGTTFTIRLPIHKKSIIQARRPLSENIINRPKAKEHVVPPYGEDKPNVLVVEDNKDVAYYLSQCLQSQFYVHHELNGALGIQHALDHVPDLIISDIMMPEKDGFEVCETLKEDPRTNHIPIILLTAKTTRDDKITGLKKGADAFLPKPLDKEELLVRIEKLMELREELRAKYSSAMATFQLKSKSNPISSTSSDMNEKFLSSVIDTILENIENHLFKGPLLARKLGMSESQLYRKLKAITGKSTALFIRSIRLKKAKELLSEGQSNVSEVAYDCGFNDPSWFSRAYKEEFGFPPSDIAR